MKRNWTMFGLGMIVVVVLESVYMKGYVHDFVGALNRKIDSIFD